MLAPVLHVLPLATITRERTLPVAGKVNVHVNQRVNPTDVIAEASYAREHVLLDVARTFGVSASDADKMIKVNQGDRVMQNAMIAESGGMFPRTIKAPRAGRVMVVGSGQVLMEVGDTRVELRAGLPGVVTQVLPERGVVIRTAKGLQAESCGLPVRQRQDLESAKLDFGAGLSSIGISQFGFQHLIAVTGRSDH